jgi:hypothetical protein
VTRAQVVSLSKASFAARITDERTSPSLRATRDFISRAPEAILVGFDAEIFQAYFDFLARLRPTMKKKEHVR